MVLAQGYLCGMAVQIHHEQSPLCFTLHLCTSSRAHQHARALIPTYTAYKE